MEDKKTTKASFVDLRADVKTKLSALWASVMFCYIYGDYLTLFEPGVLEAGMAGRMPLGATNQVNLLGIALFVSIPALMIFLSLVLRPAANRRANIALGATYTAAVLLTFSMEPWAYYVFLGLVECALTILIVRYAWTWPREESA